MGINCHIFAYIPYGIKMFTWNSDCDWMYCRDVKGHAQWDLICKVLRLLVLFTLLLLIMMIMNI